MDALTRDRLIRLAGVDLRAFKLGQLRDPRNGQWIDEGALRKLRDVLAEAIDGATTTWDWRGAHVTAPVNGHPVTVTISPFDVASLALLFVPGAQGPAAAATTARTVAIVAKIRKALAAASAASTVAGAVTTGPRDLDHAGAEERRAPYPGGQKYKHGWIPIAVAAVNDLISPAEAARDYGDELDRVEFSNSSVVARSEGMLTVQSDLDDGVKVFGAPSPAEAQSWADHIDGFLDGDVQDRTVDDGLLIGRGDTGGVALRWIDDDVSDDLDDHPGFDLGTDDEAQEFAGALRDMAYITEDHQNVPDDDDDDEAASDDDLDDDEDDVGQRSAAALARHRMLQLLGVELRKWSPAQAAKHPRNPTGTPGAGQFRNVAIRVLIDIYSWVNNGASGPDPLAGYSQPQLKTAAMNLGLNPPKGMKLAPLKALLIAHGRRQHAAGVTLPSPAAAVPNQPTAGQTPTGIAAIVATARARQLTTPRSGMTYSASVTSGALRQQVIGTIHRDATGWHAEPLPGQGQPTVHASRKQAITALAVAHVRAFPSAASATVPQVANAPSGATKVSRAVAGVTGVTATVIPNAPVPVGSPSWMKPARQTLEIHLNGTTIGTIEQLSWGWSGTPTSGASMIGTRPTKTAVIQALVRHHQLNTTGNLTTGVAGVTLTKLPRVFGNAPDHYHVMYNGVDVGSVHGDHSALFGDWTPFPPTATPQSGFNSWSLSNPGSKTTRDDAIQELVDSYNLNQQHPNLYQTSVSGARLAPWSGSGGAFSSTPGSVSLDVFYNGVDLGDIHTSGPPGSGAQWTALISSYGGFTFPSGNQGQTFATKDDAVQGLVDAYHLHQFAQAASTGMASSPAPPPPNAPQFSTRPAANAVGGSRSEIVSYGGRDIGTIEYDPIGDQYFAYEPYAAVVGAGAIGVHATKQQAMDDLLQAYQAANGPITATPAAAALAPATLPPTRLKKLPGATRTFDVYSGTGAGVHIGQVGPAPNGSWRAFDRSMNQIPGSPFKTRKAAVDALNAHHHQGQSATAAPTPTPAAPRSPQVDPSVKAAQDILYGVDPKGKTATRQLSVYGAMRKSHFDTLDATEQSTLLGDLSFIATTSKGPNAAKAQKLIDRFTPPGTPAGAMPTPSAQIVGPANGTQTRLPTPKAGALQQAANSGKRGDKWLPGTAGPNVWGEYGSGGLLLRHVDAQGVERFLMTQRGPAISDPGKWSYPGGAFESLEDFYQGATREVEEELGWIDTDFAPAVVHGYHVFERPDVKAIDGATGRTKPWTYHSIAADMPTMLVPNLQTASAKAETSDARWMTRAEIDKLDQQGKLHGPVAGGKLQRNVMSLFPPAATTVQRPSPVTSRPARLTGTPSTPVRPTAHKPSLGRNLIATTADQGKLRADVSAIRKNYRGKTADERLAAIAHLQGFDDTPTVMSKSEIDRLLATGDYIEAWRGVSGGWNSNRKTAAQINEEFRTGPAYFGTGIFGNGYYFATDKQIAKGYSDHTKNSLLRVLIPKTAKTQPFRSIHKQVKSASSSSSYHYSSGGGRGQGTLHDEGRYAAALGLDGIENDYHTTGPGGGNTHAAKPGKPTYTWVNRSVMIVQEADP